MPPASCPSRWEPRATSICPDGSAPNPGFGRAWGPESCGRTNAAPPARNDPRRPSAGIIVPGPAASTGEREPAKLTAMLPVLSAQQMRAFDRRATDVLGVPSLELMENAGAGAAEGIR